MSFGRRGVVATCFATTAAVLLGIGVSTAAEPILAGTVRDAEPAAKPFRGMTAADIRVGRKTLDVVVADDDPERIEGLRERSTIGRYDGMLFVFPIDYETAFTMSTVPVPLSIGFYDERGRVVDRLRMEPCTGSDADCPLYEPSGPFTYALETLAGDLPRGRLRPAPG